MNINEKNSKFLDEFYTLQENEELDSNNTIAYDGGKSKIEKAIANLELEHDIIRKQWVQLIQTYEQLGLTSEAIEKVKRLVSIADAKASSNNDASNQNV